MEDFDDSRLRSATAPLFTRFGHLTELSLDRFAAGELAIELHDTVVEHLESCERCGDHWESLDAEPLRLEPPAGLEQSPAASGRIATGVFGLTAIMVAAAAILLILWPQPQQASRHPGNQAALMASPYTSTSADFDLATVTGGMDVSAFAEADADEPLTENARVSTEDEVEVRLHSRDPHYAAVVLIDEYPDADGGTGGMADTAAEVELLMPATRFARGEDRALVVERQDRRDGEFSQRVVVLMCHERFSVLTLGDLEERESAPGCRSTELNLRRFSEIADS